jgi:hypothetical protein
LWLGRFSSGASCWRRGPAESRFSNPLSPRIAAPRAEHAHGIARRAERPGAIAARAEARSMKEIRELTFVQRSNDGTAFAQSS